MNHVGRDQKPSLVGREHENIRPCKRMQRTTLNGDSQAVVSDNHGIIINNARQTREIEKPGTPISTALAIPDDQFIRRNDIHAEMHKLLVARSRVALVGPAGTG